MKRFASVFLLLLFATPALAEGVAISGALESPLNMTVSELAALAQTEVKTDFITGNRKEIASYKGPLLWSVLQKAVLKDKGKNPHLHHMLLMRAKDGYLIAMSMSELHPDYGNVAAILALTRDGAPVQDGVRMIVSGDKHGGRAVRDIASIEIIRIE